MNELDSLVTQAQAGDRDAANALATRFQRFVFGQAFGWLKDHAEAELVTQDVLSHAYFKIGQLKCPKAYPSWLRQMTYRMAMNSINRRRHNAELLDQSVTDMDAHAILLKQEDAETLREAVANLKPTDRLTLTEFYLKRKSVKQLAEEQDAPIGTIKRRLHTARHRLRKHYEDAK